LSASAMYITTVCLESAKTVISQPISMAMKKNPHVLRDHGKGKAGKEMADTGTQHTRRWLFFI
jgi:hypothetical protein